VTWLVLVVATPLLTLLGYFLKTPLLLPLLQVLPAYPLLVHDLRREQRTIAVLRILLWAALIAVSMEMLALESPTRGEVSVLHGKDYRDEMLGWIRTGVGKESSPASFIPEHLLHLGLFVFLSLASGGFLSLILGAVLMNYMSFYVGSLLGIAQTPAKVLLYGWPPWAVLRVVSFVILGVVLSGPLLKRLGWAPFDRTRVRGWIIAAAIGLVLDVTLKTLLAPHWSGVLRSAPYTFNPWL
jgi:hypothetical protein